ncbi:MAG: TlpA family protein disulfide reductase [Chloroflexi bacterium]|nr:TlpA family protein disulfide reductase [Chloroflexota bacterium]
MKRSSNTLLLLGAGLLIGLGAGCLLLALTGAGGALFFGLQSSLSGEDSILFPEVDSPAPPFELQSLAGETYRLEDLHGQPVVVNFWATWCAPCRLEMPLLDSYQAQYGDQLTILAVNFDEPQDLVQRFVDELGLTLPVLLDPGGKVVNQYRVRGYPTTVFIDAEGVIRYQHMGQLEERQLARYLEEMGVSLE